MTLNKETMAELAARDPYAALAELRRLSTDQECDPNLRLMAQTQLILLESAMVRPRQS